MSAISVALSEEQETGILARIERGLFEYIVAKRSSALDELTSFSLNEIAAAKGMSVREIKGFLTRRGISIEVLQAHQILLPRPRLQRLRQLSLLQHRLRRHLPLRESVGPADKS